MSTKLPLITTADQLLAASDDLGPCELVRGEWITITPAGYRRGRIGNRIQSILSGFVDPENRTLTIHRPDAEPRVLHESDTVTEPALLPGFTMLAGKIFPS